MEKISQLFDELLVHSYSYPSTIFRLIFIPKSIFGKSKSFDPIGPGVCFFYSCFIVYAVAMSIVPEGEGAPKWLGSNGLLAVAILYMAVLANIQRLVTDFLVTSENTIKEKLKLLFYPNSVVILGVAIIFLFMMKDGKIDLFSDSHNPTLKLVVILVVISYFIGLFNTFRCGLDVSNKKSFLCAFIALLLYFLYPALLGYFVVMWDA